MKRWIIILITLLPLVLRAADTPTVMSPFEVRAQSVSFQGWIKRTSPHFVVYTDGSSAEASKALREFEMLRAAGESAFRRVAANYGPTILILPTGSSDWRKLESKGDVEWKSAGSNVGGFIAPVLVAQYDWERLGLGIMRAIYSDTATHEMDLAGPFWFHQGFRLFYETATFDGDRVTLGQINQRVFYLQSHPWIPWDRFFQVDATSAEYIQERFIGTYDAQAALFTQFLFSNPDRTWMTKLVSWLDTVRSGAKPSEEQFKAIFGQDWNQWHETMQRYISGGKYSVLKQKMPPAIIHYAEGRPDLPVREIRDLFVLTQTLVQKTPDSEVSLDALLVTGLHSTNLRELLVAACLEWDKPDAALRITHQLIDSGSTNALVYQVGDTILNTNNGPFGLNSRRGAEAPELEAWNQRGLALEPLNATLNNLCALNQAAGLIVDQQSIITIENCYRRIKGRAATDEVIAALAMALWRMGENSTASALATKLASDPLTAPRWRAMATHLAERIEAQKSLSTGSDPTSMPVEGEPAG